MSWWQTTQGFMGDAPADLAQGTVKRVAAGTSAAQLVAAIARVIATDGAKLFADADESACWAVRAREGGRPVAHAAAPPDKLVAQVRSCARKIAASYRGELGRPPSGPELVGAFASVLTTGRFAIELAAELDEPGLRRADLMVRRRLALDPVTPVELVEVLARDAAEIVRNAAKHRLDHLRRVAEARDPATPATRLVELASQPAPGIAAAVLANPAADAVVLDALVRSPLADVRVALATDARATPAMIDRLCEDAEPDVRLAVLRRSELSGDALRKLARPSPRDLRHVFVAICRQPHVPVEVLEQLATSGDLEVRRAALHSPKFPAARLAQHLEEGRDGTRRLIAGSPVTPAEIQLALARDDDQAVRVALAARSSFPDAVADTLARDSNEDVRLTLAGNRHCPRHALDILSKDSSPDVARAARDVIKAS